MPSPLDNPVWSAITGAQSTQATTNGLAGRYLPDLAPFGAFRDPPTDAHWDALAELVGPGGQVALVGDHQHFPDGWRVLWDGNGIQMRVDGIVPTSAPRPPAGAPDEDIVPLGPADADAMLALIALTNPGPFLRRTVELGRYLGIRCEGELVGMAGERMRPDGHTEISAVATHPDHRKRGIAAKLVGEVASGIRLRGEVPFLHVAETNAGAIRLYASMGFTVRRKVRFTSLQLPDPR